MFWFLRTILGIVAETATVSLRTLAFFFPLVTDTFSSFNANDSLSNLFHGSRFCKRGEIVQGDEGPVGGVAQVVSHGVIVVVGHQEEGQEEEGEKQGEVEGEANQLRENRTSWMIWRWGDKRENGLEP